MKQDIVKLLEGELPQVIVFSGDDYIGREKAKENIINKLYLKYTDITEERFDSTREPFEVYIERIITPSLFQSVRIFHIRHVQDYTDRELHRLEVILSTDFPDVYVIIEFEAKNGRKAKKQSVATKLAIKSKVKNNPKKYLHLQFDKPPDYKLAEWLTIQVPILFNRRISKEGAECILDLAGNELDKLYSELQKIDIHLPDKASIDKVAVETITDASRAMSPYELAGALGQKNLPRVLEIIESLYQHNFYAPPTIAVIFRHFWNVLKVRAYANENKDTANAYFRAQYTEKTKIAHEIGVKTGLLRESDPEKKAYPVMILSRIIDQASEFNNEHLKQIFIWLRDFDVGIKTGYVKPTKQAFQLLCYRIVRVAELAKKDAVL